MKKILIIILLLISIFETAQSQYKERTSAYNFAGIGFSLMFYTQSVMADNYPTIDFRNNNYMSKFDIYIGRRFTNIFEFEFYPSIIYNRSNSRPGFNFYDKSMKTYYYYVPQNLYLFMLPLTAKLKIYPLGGNTSSLASGIFLGLGGGACYIYESYDNFIYSDPLQTSALSYKTYTATTWASNMIFSAGFQAGTKFSYGVELDYRIIPLPVNGDQPLSSRMAPNMNSVNLTIKILFNF